MHPFAKYPIIKFSEFAKQYHHTHQMHPEIDPIINGILRGFHDIGDPCW